MFSMRLVIVLFACCLVAGPIVAQQSGANPPAHVEVPTIVPRAEDVATIDGVMKAFYDVISGPAGQPRQWSRDRTLYHP